MRTCLDPLSQLSSIALQTQNASYPENLLHHGLIQKHEDGGKSAIFRRSTHS